MNARLEINDNEVRGQKKHAHVKTPEILNKFPENKFFVECMVWP